MRVRAAALVCLLAASLALVAGCGDETPSHRAQPGTNPSTPSTSVTTDVTAGAVAPRPSPPATPGGQHGADHGPPDLVVHAPDGNFTAHRGSYCWTVGEAGMCADAVAPDVADLPRLAGTDEVSVSFPLPGFTFQASFAPLTSLDPHGDRCFRTRTAVVSADPDGDFSLAAMGPAGTYVVSLFGEGPQGDLSGMFVWTTDRAGSETAPTAYIGIAWELHGEVDGGHGLNLSVSDLARTPRKASATVTATAANGRSVTVDAGRPDLGCPLQGSAYWWENDASRSQQVVDLGPPPYTYDVTLTLDGVDHHATATWPDDHVVDPFNDDPAPVPLDFSPPLPGLGG